MTISSRKSYQAAINKAQQLRPQVTDLGSGRYTVQGTSQVYTVTVDQDGEYSCTCQAGERGQACYHQGSVYLKRLSQQAFGITPGGPAPASLAGRWSEADDDQSDYRAIYATQRVAA